MINQLLEIAIPLLVAIVGLVCWIIKLVIRSRKLCEITNVMGGEYGILLAKDKNNKYIIDMDPDFREKLEETYKRYRSLDIDKK